jgi:type I site-specific restriction endonuclease
MSEKQREERKLERERERKRGGRGKEGEREREKEREIDYVLFNTEAGALIIIPQRRKTSNVKAS